MGHATFRTGGLPKSWQRKGCSPPHLQKQSVPKLCLHAVKPDAFQQLNPLPRYFSFFRQSFAVVGSHGLMVQQDEERPWCGARRGIGAGKSKSQCPCHCRVQAGGRAGRALAAAGSKTCWPGDPHRPVRWEKGWWFADKTLLAAKSPVHYRGMGFLREAVIMLLLNYQINCRNSKLITVLQVRLLVGDKENQP